MLLKVFLEFEFGQFVGAQRRNWLAGHRLVYHRRRAALAWLRLALHSALL